MFDVLLQDTDCAAARSVLDAGSGRTSLGILTEKFPHSVIDAVCFPGDRRKLDSIVANVARANYRLIERDICKPAEWGEYDFIVAHLLLGEAVKFGNNFGALLGSLIAIKGKHLVIIDYPEDPGVDFERIFADCRAAGYETVREHTVKKTEPLYGSSGELIGTYYRGVLFKLV